MATAAKKITLGSPDLTLVIPVFNEEQSIKLLCEAVNEVIETLPKNTDLILVDDGSTDETVSAIKKCHWKLPLTLIELSRNFGHQAALIAGLEAAGGKAVVTLDADLQHPLALIPELYRLSQEGYEVVLTQRIDDATHVPLSKRLTSALFYNLLRFLSSTSVPINTSDFRLLKRSALNELLAMPEHSKFLRGMVNWIGFKSIIVPFKVGARSAGDSKYSLRKMLKLAFHGITSFSVMPLYFSVIFSVVLFIAAFLYALYVLYIRFFGDTAIEGWASVLFVLLVLGGFITLFLGLMGSYLAAIFEEVKQRPSYIKKAESHIKK